MDAGGAADTAFAVGGAWIDELGLALVAAGAGAGLHIDRHPTTADGGAICLYRGTHLLACATVFRDQMNFSVLIRWRLPEEFDCDQCDMAEPSRIACLAHDCPYRIGRYTHEGWPSDGGSA